MLDVALGTSPSKLRGAALTKDIVHPFARGRGWVVVSPLAPPRMWSHVTDVVARAFESVAVSDDGPLDAMRVQRAVGAGAQALVRAQSALVEPNLPLDAQIVGVLCHDSVFEVAISSGMRVFRARGAEPKRLLNNAQRSPGILRGGLLVSTERLQRGDLFVLGSRDAFGAQSMGAVAGLLARTPDAAPDALLKVALASCRASEIAAALVVVRVR